MNKIERRNGKSGFTLIEIIAVLVILAVLAAVAIPQYIDLMTNARQSALQGAIATGQSQCSLAYGSLILAGGAVPGESAIATAAQAALATATDFTYALAGVDGSGTISITATDTSGASRVGAWTMP